MRAGGNSPFYQSVLCRAWWLEGNLTGASRVLEYFDPRSRCWLPESIYFVKIHKTAHLWALFNIFIL